MTPDGVTPRRSMRAAAGGVMWLLAVLAVGAALAITRDPGLWVVLLDHGSTISFVLICLSGLLLAVAGPVFGVRSVRARGLGYVAAAVVTLCATGTWVVSGELDTLSLRGVPARTVAISADGRFEVVSRDAFSGRPYLWLRSRAGLFSREAQDDIDCFVESDGSSYDFVDLVEFTGPHQLRLRWRDGQTGTVDFDGPTLIVTGRQGGCAGPEPAPGR
ncbi:hypothetical protein AB0B66_07585 [Catellatospora sp. NPDC049111]|uniref:hypothetical protein n=1 Tax=Catellatospora sp. NPDC049111 TaxID=3155271 RepID=UPI0033D9F61A